MDAQQICKNNNSTLPIVDSANSQRSFVAALSYYGLNGMNVWLGANASDKGSDNWHWLDESQYKQGAGRHAITSVHIIIIISGWVYVHSN